MITKNQYKLIKNVAKMGAKDLIKPFVILDPSDAFSVKIYTMNYAAEIFASVNTLMSYRPLAMSANDFLMGFNPDGEWSAQSIGDKITIKSGYVSFDVELTDLTEDQKTIMNNFKKESFIVSNRFNSTDFSENMCYSKDTAKYILTGLSVKVDKDSPYNHAEVAATDGYKLCIKNRAGFTMKPTHEFIVPAEQTVKALKCFNKKLNVIVSHNENNVEFHGEDMVFITKKIQGKYPDYNKIIRRDSLHTATIDFNLLVKNASKKGMCEFKFNRENKTVEIKSFIIDKPDSNTYNKVYTKFNAVLPCVLNSVESEFEINIDTDHIETLKKSGLKGMIELGINSKHNAINIQPESSNDFYMLMPLAN